MIAGSWEWARAVADYLAKAFGGVVVDLAFCEAPAGSAILSRVPYWRLALRYGDRLATVRLYDDGYAVVRLEGEGRVLRRAGWYEYRPEVIVGWLRELGLSGRVEVEPPKAEVPISKRLQHIAARYGLFGPLPEDPELAGRLRRARRVVTAIWLTYLAIVAVCLALLAAA